MNVFVLKTRKKEKGKSELFFANALPSFYFLLSDSSALDTQVFSHYYHQPCAFVILLHVHVFVHTFVLCLVMWGFVEFVTPLNLKTTLIWAPFPELVLSVGVNTACASEPFYCHCVMPALLLQSFSREWFVFQTECFGQRGGSVTQ